jgi:hypothetical protein
MTLPPANWYQDPKDPSLQRYWDGAAWTDFTNPAGGEGRAAPASPSPVGFSDPPRSRRGLWIGLAIGGVAVVALVVVGIVAIAGRFAPISTEYTGAPVTASDTAPEGKIEVISPSESLALEIPTAWVDANDYVDIESAVGDLPEGGTFIGAWYTEAPTATTIPQFIMVVEFDSGAAGPGTLDDLHRQVMTGVRVSSADVTITDATSYRSTIGLEGRTSDATIVLTEDFTAHMRVTTLGHGRHLAMFTWTSYSGPIDEQGMSDVLESMRIDA